jgi:hypothetical protein
MSWTKLVKIEINDEKPSKHQDSYQNCMGFSNNGLSVLFCGHELSIKIE